MCTAVDLVLQVWISGFLFHTFVLCVGVRGHRILELMKVMIVGSEAKGYFYITYTKR